MKRRGFARLAVAALGLFLAVSSVCAQTDLFVKGRVIERVTSRADPGQSYALYLPSEFTAEKRWPLVIAFDPAARGAVPVERFKEAAEKYGYVVMGSNNSRNGPRSEASASLAAMWADAKALFSIDERRVYAAGFSGGARVAASVGYALKDAVAGVIACGAGFPQEAEPSASTPFVFFATVGTEDFNYGEVRGVEKKLKAAGVAHRVEVFEGGHDWASSELCVRAIEWMEIQAIKSGRLARDEKFVEEIFKKEIDRARLFESSGRAHQAYASFEAAARDFKGLKDTSELEARALQLKESKEVRQATRQEEKQEAEQERRLQELFALRARAEAQNNSSSGQYTGNAPDSINPAEGRMQALAELRRAIDYLRARSRAVEGSAERVVARRVLSLYGVWSYEKANMLLRTGKYSLAIASFSVDAETTSDSWQPFYNLACAYSLAGDKKRAVDALKRAEQKGFANAPALERNKDFDPIRAEPEFIKLLEEVRRKQG
jgi:predicted esterase